MLQFPNAKINLGLSVLRKRSDGFHDLETVFVPIAWYDALEFVPASVDSLHTHGIPVTGPPELNLVWKAYQLIRNQFPNVPPLEIHLDKKIPHGAGLGGGSANASFMLKGLNQYFDLGLNNSALLEMALELGSDCPFFIHNKPCIAYGRGEILNPITLHLHGWRIVLVKPALNLSTALAFQSITPMVPEVALNELINEPITQWRNKLFNDFEAPLAKHYPEIKLIRESLYNAGCVYAALSGSGSTVLGIFKSGEEDAIHLLETNLHKKIRDLTIKITDFIL